jgi:GNAT superfamily N-acetyltransferase
VLEEVEGIGGKACDRSAVQSKRIDRCHMIRRCDERDFELILSIINDGALAYKSVIPADCWTEPYMSRDELHAEMEDGVSFWGYEENEALSTSPRTTERRGGVNDSCEGPAAPCALMGVMGIQQMEDVTLIRHAYVRTGSQKRGIGGRLLSHLRELAHGPVLIGTWADAVWQFASMRSMGSTSLLRRRRHAFSSGTGTFQTGRWKRRWCWLIHPGRTR